MATNFAHVTAAPVSPPGAAPFLLNPAKRAPNFAAALEAAVVAEAASHDARRNTRCRLSYLLCEVANQLRQQGSSEVTSEFPLSRFDLAELLGTSLCKVKRVLALLSLSGVVATDGRTIQVLDWRRLCSVAHVDPARLALTEPEEEDDDMLMVVSLDERPANLVNAIGEPACFV